MYRFSSQYDILISEDISDVIVNRSKIVSEICQ